MLNRLLERKGREVGVIVSGGMEDYLRTERAIQTYLGYPFSDRLHVITHHHNEPLVPRERILGVRGRIDLFGREIIPLYEGDVRDAVHSLIDHEVASIVVCLLFSYKNKDHERRVREIGQEVMAERGVAEKPDLPVERALPDAPGFSPPQLHHHGGLRGGALARDVAGGAGGVPAGGAASSSFESWRVHGGTISINARELARTMISGPIGGVVGSKFLSERIDVPNIAVHRYRRHFLRYRADHGRRVLHQARARHRPDSAQHADGADRFRGLGHRLLRPASTRSPTASRSGRTAPAP